MSIDLALCTCPLLKGIARRVWCAALELSGGFAHETDWDGRVSLVVDDGREGSPRGGWPGSELDSSAGPRRWLGPSGSVRSPSPLPIGNGATIAGGGGGRRARRVWSPDRPPIGAPPSEVNRRRTQERCSPRRLARRQRVVRYGRRGMWPLGPPGTARSIRSALGHGPRHVDGGGRGRRSYPARRALGAEPQQGE